MGPVKQFSQQEKAIFLMVFLHPPMCDHQGIYLPGYLDCNLQKSIRIIKQIYTNPVWSTAV